MSSNLSTGSRNSGGAVVATALLSNPCISDPLILIFSFLNGGGPLPDGVGGTADRGVAGTVAEAGVRGTAVDCLRLFRGSGVFA